ncbi:biotin synthase BioB [Candidatus Haliotispira prima]|uniref:Biotin synthase n=1 Tax=Candidatus Haliotispira prima TaxID=3034016 RepID=A0ABY8MFK9_9SPIO|nr:biotin synthase BioB [Candidatus Haliotispira prima]
MADILETEQDIPDKEADLLRYDRSKEESLALFELPFMGLLHQAHSLHCRFFDPNQIQLSTLLSIKSGGCSEDCGYCSQSSHHSGGVKETGLMNLTAVKEAAEKAKNLGAGRFCMGAAWRNPNDEDMPHLLEMVRTVKELGLETCMTLGMLSDEQTTQLRDAGLDYYNHNVDTSEEYYSKVVSTRSYQDRIKTLKGLQRHDIKVCTGGIIGLGETVEDRASMLCTLAALEPHPQSVPINMLVPVEGTPSALNLAARVDPFDFVRTIAVAKIMMPASRIRLSAGRTRMSQEMQALCFYAGANSIFYGDKLLTTDNQDAESDRELLAKLGMHST